MLAEEIIERYNEVPEIIKSSIEMTEANCSIQVFSGNYLIRNEKGDLNVNGEIVFNWVASSGSHFFGAINADTQIANSFSISHDKIQIIVDGLLFGEGHINNKTIGTDISGTEIKGRLLGQACFGDKSIAVEKLVFTIPNLRDFHGTVVKSKTETTFSTLSNRLTLENDFCIINIDKCKDFKNRIQSLEEKGGFNILYNCELVPKKGSIKLEDTPETFHCLSTFLTFLNGRRTSAFFIQGVCEEQVLWCDYTDYLVDSYKYVQTWPQKTSVIGLSKMWENFSTLWKDSNNKNFFISAIHWYVEANANSGFTEGSIIMTQTALELLYNWWIIESKKMIIGKDSENINAANKIRLLLSQLDISHSVPLAFTHLQQFVDENENITDAPEAIVHIRNAIVHSQHEKRKKLDSIHYMAKYEALQLSIWYIEMTLLKILDFEGKYFNRCSRKMWASEAEVFPPWSSKG
jgi:hypothetical protein